MNIAEHFIIGTVSLLGILILFLFNDMVSLIGLWKPAAEIFGILDKASFILLILFPAVTYWNAFKKFILKTGPDLESVGTVCSDGNRKPCCNYDFI
ncbi:hypothetical protein HHL23_01555 [Chryseobacterium sp. RP-3-3]|uniref:Uncharacterized protein n=1 Tax=Chryseobacterium antibioticum TaxID=2728847 RepID=A0A7Y0FQK5_9FLAO|nr:hypothetical protein [Chryseobacterium antibioticum]NML68489.1 hypothetical protein [Chryseobacterium antibioticum]